MLPGYGRAMTVLDVAQRLLPRRHRTVLIAVHRDGETLHRTVGADEGSDGEIGSVSKGMTGLLLHDSIARGEVTAASTLGDTLGLSGALAPVTLGALATHHAGVPPQPAMGPERPLLRRTWRMWTRGENPYGDTLAQLIEQAESTALGRPGFVYSNLGFELLGAALARAAGTSFAALLRDRLTVPLGMTDTYAPATRDELRPAALTGTSRRGRPHAAWTGEAIAPAGGVRATAADLGAFVGALAEGSAPGIGALDPVAEAGRGARIGAAWITLEAHGRVVTWHNGRTGGFASFVGVDREARAAVGVVSATAAGFDAAGLRMLDAVARA